MRACDGIRRTRRGNLKKLNHAVEEDAAKNRRRAMGIGMIVTMAIATATGNGCSWAHPGANPYRGEPSAALADFSMPAEDRRQLHALMAARRYTDIVTITRDAISGQRQYVDLREMHSGHGQRCHGDVDRSAWSATHEERGLVYCVGEVCVIVPTSCNNVSLVTREPEEAPLHSGADEPIDIDPAAGAPPSPAVDVSTAQDPDSGPLELIPSEDVPDSPGSAGSPGGGGTFGGGGVISCCGPWPVGPGEPTTPPVPPASPVPETATWVLLLAAAALLLVVAERKRYPGLRPGSCPAVASTFARRAGSSIAAGCRRTLAFGVG